MNREEYTAKLNHKLETMPDNVYLKYLQAGLDDVDLTSEICVQIPVYCDPEIIRTMQSCVQAAVNPDRIHFAVCYQGDDMDVLEQIKSFDNCKVKHLAKKDAKGVCNARYECTKLADNEDFALHIDGHMRFAEFWDVAIFQQWRDCHDDNAILSSYALDYMSTFDEDVVTDKRLPADFNGQYINSLYFIPSGKLRFAAKYCFGDDYSPRRSPFIGAHCAFLPLRIDKEIPTDPNMYFSGDELSVAVRYWTHGYDIYQFGMRFIYHLYSQEEMMRKRFNEYDRLTTKSPVADRQAKIETKRLSKLLRLTNDPSVDLTGFDLGNARTVTDYQEFAGVNFKNQIITDFSANGAYDAVHSIDDLKHFDYSDAAKQFNELYGDCEKYKHLTIAVMIYAIRNDDDVLHLINNMRNTAAYPDRLHFYIAYTDLRNKTVKQLQKLYNNVTLKEVPDYKGLQNSYYVLDSMYSDETYALYIRDFVVPKANWDIYYINVLQKLGDKAFISERLDKYTSKNSFDRKNSAVVLGASSLLKNYLVSHINIKSGEPYVRGAFIHDFLFIRGSSVKECPHDPYLTERDAQLSHSIRLWTYGYDLYNLDRTYFLLSGKSLLTGKLTDNDVAAAKAYYRDSDARMDNLYGRVDKPYSLNEFSFGHVRSLKSFEDFAGIDVLGYKVSINAMIGNFGASTDGVLARKLDISLLKQQMDIRNASMGEFIAKLEDCVNSFTIKSKITEIFDEYGLGDFLVIDNQEQLNKEFSLGKSGAIKARLLNAVKKYDTTDALAQPAVIGRSGKYAYTVKDALAAMFTGRELRNAHIICAPILSKVVLTADNTVEGSVGGIYFNTDNIRKIDSVDRPLFAVSAHNVEGVPTVCTTIPADTVWRYFASKIIQRSKSKNILVTGSDGKTTTKCIISEILKLDCKGDERFVCSVRNENGAIPFCKDVGVNFDDVKYYVKEYGVGGKTDFLSEFSKQFSPDACVIVNIGECCHFEGGFKTRQDVFDTKIRCIDGMKSNGVLLINKDDDMLRSAEYSCDTVTFAIHDKSADYTCEDVVEENEYLTFTAVCPDRKIENIRMNVHGLHNIYGALSGIALADRFGASDDAIVRGLANFKSDGIRQTVYTAYKNNTVLFDCFGCSVESDTTMLKSLMSIKVPEGARHIAFLGHMATLGEHADEMHRKLAKIIATEFDLDLLVCFGGKSKYFCEESLKAGKRAVFFNDDIEAMCFIRDELKDGDAILVKGCGSYRFGELFKTYLENDAIVKPVYTGLLADDNEAHGVSASLLCRNIDTDEVYVDKYVDVKRLPYHVSILFVIAALCDIYKDRMSEQISVDSACDSLFYKYMGDYHVINPAVTVQLDANKQYAIKDLLKISLDYTALNVVYSLIAHIGDDVFKQQFDVFLQELDCNDTFVTNPHSRNMGENVTTANDVYKVLKHFVKSDVFADIVNANVDALVPPSLYSQKSKLIRLDVTDEEGVYCPDVIIAKKMYDLFSASCIAVAKIGDDYIACVALDRAIVYKNHAPDADVSRMVNAVKRYVDESDKNADK